MSPRREEQIMREDVVARIRHVIKDIWPTARVSLAKNSIHRICALLCMIYVVPCISIKNTGESEILGPSLEINIININCKFKN